MIKNDHPELFYVGLNTNEMRDSIAEELMLITNSISNTLRSLTPTGSDDISPVLNHFARLNEQAYKNSYKIADKLSIYDPASYSRNVNMLKKAHLFLLAKIIQKDFLDNKLIDENNDMLMKMNEMIFPSDNDED